MKHLYAGLALFVAGIGLSTVGQAEDYSKKSPQEIAGFLCMAQVKLSTALREAEKLEKKVNQPTPLALTQVAREEASYLPAGFPQTNPGYDTCSLTGVGYYFDMDNKRQFHNCDPEAPRYFEVDCRKKGARFVDKELVESTAVGGARFQVMPFDPRTTDVCAVQPKRTGGGAVPRVVFKTPACENILSTFNINNSYLACDSNSVTYQDCAVSLEGTYHHRKDYTTVGSFCAMPQGTKVVNHVEAFNKDKVNELKNISEDLSQDIPVKLKNVQLLIQQHQIACDAKGRALSIAGIKVR